MDNNFIKKGIILFIIFLLVFTNIIVNINANKLTIFFIKNKDTFYNDNSEFISKISEPKIIIEDISGGIGLNLIIRNVGSIDIDNIEINVNATGFLNILLLKNHYIIPLLRRNESSNIKVKLFGFCFGILKKYCKITFLIKSSYTDTIKSNVSAKIFGPIVRIVSITYDTDKIFTGYTLFTPEMSRKIYLIDNDGNVVHKWTSKHIQGLGTYLLENGNVLRSDAAGFNLDWMVRGETGRVEMFNWNGSQLWDLLYINKTHCLHNDIEPLPNDNVLLIVWGIKTKEEAIEAGCDPNDPRLVKRGELWTDTIIEVEQDGYEGVKIVWKWDVWDHLIQDYDPSKDNYGIVADHPELIDINFRGMENVGLDLSITHLNSVDYNEEFDQILLSSRFLSEILVIDHNTTIQEAAGHTGGRYGKGGDILYRWGNPQVYQNGDKYDQKLFLQHDAQWVEKGFPGEGHITIFNNGVRRRDGNYSSIDEICPPVNSTGHYKYIPGSAFGPEEPIWNFTTDNPADMYSSIMSSAQRLPNGNTLICSSTQGLFLEVTHEKNIVWEYRNYVANPLCSRVFKIQRYPSNYPGLVLLNS